MPLPEGGKQAWPPEHCQKINEQLAVWVAWYEGDPDKLAAIYAGENNTGPGAEFYASEKGGFKATARRLLDRARRWFWGNRNPTGQPRNRLHVPLAGDIAAASADLIFSEPPMVTVDDEQTQARLDELYDDGTHASLLEAAEIAAALGGVYLRVCWDPATRPDRPWLAAVHPDAAVPEFHLGRLTAVTFWRIIHREDREIVRHLERHELPGPAGDDEPVGEDGQPITKTGRVRHGVYAGDDEQLGTPVPLDAYPETAGLLPEVDTGTTALTAVYVPNMRPNRCWRNTPHAAPLGRSDFAGVEGLMDSLDLTYSSWMRDVELGKARLIVPKEYLTSHGKGQGASVDLDREVYEPVNVMGGDEGKPEIEQVQFAIRVEEHRSTVHDLKVSIVSAAGYSAQTFGLDEGGQAVTATEIAAQTRRSLITRDRKTNYWGPGLADITEALLGVDVKYFTPPGVVAQRPTVEWPDAVSEDPKAVAETVELWARGEAASIETRVRRIHPDWDDPEVADEVQRIRDDMGATTADPLGEAVTTAARAQPPAGEVGDSQPEE